MTVVDARLVAHYDRVDEAARLTRPGRGTLLRERTRDIFARYLPAGGHIADIGGGPGVHAEWLASHGYTVSLLDPVPNHVRQARLAAKLGPHPFAVYDADARRLPFADGTVDAAVSLGPIYHLTSRQARLAAHHEAARVLRPEGIYLVETFSRHAELLLSVAARRPVPDTFDYTAATGLADPGDGTAPTYRHTPEEIHDELTDAGFADLVQLPVDGILATASDLVERMRTDPDGTLALLRSFENRPGALDVTCRLITVAVR